VNPVLRLRRENLAPNVTRSAGCYLSSDRLVNETESRTKAMPILTRDYEGFNHLSVHEVAVEFI